MIQRIQSVYLLLVTVILAVSAFLPLGYFSTDEGMSDAVFKPLGLALEDGTYSTWALFSLLMLGAVLALITIFLFKNRPMQIRISIFNSILIIGYCAALIYFIFKLQNTFDIKFFMKWTICLPIVALILNYLAIRGIGKDEVLVRSYDRIR
ncbi:hypothetical protein Bcop_0985 [Bacteroides coprosuis DSM 18011]|uniref:DUF4293 family protein n=1 Tax=Bacteroides coprosuis DSM 18011 TaxID=679937 RepID=F3ZUM7_9BACE|nr:MULTISPECIES: DUF4293 domain-containing protein [Bacteroides]EGJ71192.1 hypothetical protein Bcop_0985 [Bacteroides coprosuis DSM 18011]HJD91545.1 DUF4293 domain-containing protein [Bacteroides coprosuis]